MARCHVQRGLLKKTCFFRPLMYCVGLEGDLDKHRSSGGQGLREMSATLATLHKACQIEIPRFRVLDVNKDRGCLDFPTSTVDQFTGGFHRNCHWWRFKEGKWRSPEGRRLTQHPEIRKSSHYTSECWRSLATKTKPLQMTKVAAPMYGWDFP